MAGTSQLTRPDPSWRCGARRAMTAALLMATQPALANSDPPVTMGREIWAGADVSSNVWLVYSGVTFAPWSGIHDDGFRFRTAGGFGEYEYVGNVESGGVISPIHFQAQTYFADFLVGYLKRLGPLTAKGFVGAAIISHDISPLDSETVAIGEEVGIKGVIELWLNIGESGWGSLDLTWASAHNTRTARARLGYRVWPKLSLGLEGGINVDSQGECRMDALAGPTCKSLPGDPIDATDLLDYGRAGAFARYEWGVSEASISAGVLGDSFSGDDEVELAPYLTVNWLTQF